MKSLRLVVLLCFLVTGGETFSVSATSKFSPVVPSTHPVGNILILDHLNINHEKGRHDWLKAFYFDFLGCAADPRKAENLEKGSKTLWANIGAHQFHLPEGKPDAQVFVGVVTLAYPDLTALQSRFLTAQTKLKGSKFHMEESKGALMVTDPWGNLFRIICGSDDDRDPRGKQPGDDSEGLALLDLTVYTPEHSNMEGIARFYEKILGAPILQREGPCVIAVGHRQTLTFCEDPSGRSHISHVDMQNDQVEALDGFRLFTSNYGPHVSIYVADLPSTYEKVHALGLDYVNPRFKRRSYNLEQAVNDCMFRCLDIVDPDNPTDGMILQLEHEVRSVVQRDGSKYKSCPFYDIPANCNMQST